LRKKYDQSKNPRVLEANVKKAKFFQKHIVEGKRIGKCATDIGVTRAVLHGYKKTEDFRQMALAYLEDSTLGGLKGNVTKLVDALDAVRPHNVESKNSDGSTNVEVKFVPDESTRFKALQEINKIYGIHAPQKRDVNVAITISSDAELFAKIDEAERNCKHVDSYIKGENGFELATREQDSNCGTFKSRQRTILQDCSIQE